MHGIRDPGHQRLAQVCRERCAQRPGEGAFLDGVVDTFCRPAHVRAATSRATARIDGDLAGRVPDDAKQFPLRANRSAGDA
jgi:hypothetical protein